MCPHEQTDRFFINITGVVKRRQSQEDIPVEAGHLIYQMVALNVCFVILKIS